MAIFGEKLAKNWVWLALLSTIILCAYIAKNDSEFETEIAQPVRIRTNIRTSNTKENGMFAHNPMKANFKKTDRTLNTHHQKNLFAVKKEVAAPAKTQLAVSNLQSPATVFVVPPVPYTYIGKMEDSPKGTVVYLLGNDKVYTVAKGEKVDPFWRLDEEFMLSLQFTYMPKNLTQILLKNPSNETPTASNVPVNPTVNSEENARFNATLKN